MSELKELVRERTEHMRWRADFREWQQARLNAERVEAGKAKELDGFLPAGRVLELGCGMGGLAVALALRGRAVVATDYNAAYCRITQLRARRAGVRVPVVRAAGEALPFRAGAFRAVTSFDVIEHVQEPEAYLRELFRVLAPGGRALLTVVNRWAARDPHYHLWGVNLLPGRSRDAYVRLRGRVKEGTEAGEQALSAMHYYRFGEFAELARTCGFRVRPPRVGRKQRWLGAAWMFVLEKG